MRDCPITFGHIGMNPGLWRGVSRGYHAVITLRSCALSATLGIRNILLSLIVINRHEPDKLQIFQIRASCPPSWSNVSLRGRNGGRGGWIACITDVGPHGDAARKGGV